MIHYLLWSNKHRMWWRPAGYGYTEEIAEAGAFTEGEAVDAVVRSAGCMDRTRVTLMVAAPPGWTPPPAEPRMFGPGPFVEVLTEFLGSRSTKEGETP